MHYIKSYTTLNADRSSNYIDYTYTIYIYLRFIFLFRFLFFLTLVDVSFIFLVVFSKSFGTRRAQPLLDLLVLKKFVV